MRFMLPVLGALAMVPGAVIAQGAGDAALLAGACQGCHGVAGQGSHGIPAIAGRHKQAEFVALLQAFRDNRREATVMGRITRGYTDADFATLAAYYGQPD
jgi:sulfide dehydrogenase cytochrome subunit